MIFGKNSEGRRLGSWDSSDSNYSTNPPSQEGKSSYVASNVLASMPKVNFVSSLEVESGIEPFSLATIIAKRGNYRSSNFDFSAMNSGSKMEDELRISASSKHYEAMVRGLIAALRNRVN